MNSYITMFSDLLPPHVTAALTILFGPHDKFAPQIEVVMDEPVGSEIEELQTATVEADV
jgi:hypothetical protein